MPYVITTGKSWSDPGTNTGGWIVDPASRRAVATLEEARDWIADQHHLLGPYPPHAVADLPETGGRIGPLLDGTVIEVKRTPAPKTAEPLTNGS